MGYEEIKIKKALKLLVKKSHFTYKELGGCLGLSEATIKRRVNSSDISIRQISQICEVLNITLFELMELSKKLETSISKFSISQEQVLASKELYFRVFRLLILGKTFLQIKNEFKMTESKLRSIFFKFEEVKLIELHPQNKVKVLIHFPFKWIREGPLEKAYFQKALSNIFNKIEKNKYGGDIKCRPFELKLTTAQLN